MHLQGKVEAETHMYILCTLHSIIPIRFKSDNPTRVRGPDSKSRGIDSNERVFGSPKVIHAERSEGLLALCSHLIVSATSLSVCLSIGWSVCHNFLKGRDVLLPCPYKRSCLPLEFDSFCHTLAGRCQDLSIQSVRKSYEKKNRISNRLKKQTNQKS